MADDARIWRGSRGAERLRVLALCLLCVEDPSDVIGQNPATNQGAGDIARSSLAQAARLPDAPAKSLVLQHCNVCHDLAWVEESGGSVQGWTSRLKRMRRAGSTLPPEKFAEVAAYLAAAFPERPRQQESRSRR